MRSMNSWPALLALLLCSCSGLRSNEPANQLYLLQPRMPTAATGAPASGSPVSGSLMVRTPAVTPGLDTERIALLRSDGRLDYYAASQWPENLSVMLQPLVIDALRAAGRFSAVHDESTPFLAEYQLQMEVRHFEVREGAKPIAQISLVVMLGRRAERTPLTSFTVEATSEAGENRMTAIIDAFNKALGSALATLADKAVASDAAASN